MQEHHKTTQNVRWKVIELWKELRVSLGKQSY